MTLDRTGEPVEDTRCANNCRNGWLTPPDSDAPRLCPLCRELPKRDNNDFTERVPSARAQAAIESENQ